MNCRSSFHSSLADVGMFLGLNRRLDKFPQVGLSGLQAAHNLDAIVVGAGHNGLTCAARISDWQDCACAFLSDVVWPVALALTEEFHRGFGTSTTAYTVSLLQPKVISARKIPFPGDGNWGGRRLAVRIWN